MNGIVIEHQVHDGEELWVEAVIAMTFGEIVESDIEEINDYAETYIRDAMEPPYCMMYLSNIGYEPLRVAEDKSIHIKVTADLVD